MSKSSDDTSLFVVFFNIHGLENILFCESGRMLWRWASDGNKSENRADTGFAS
jgi:hypothetical protein